LEGLNRFDVTKKLEDWHDDQIIELTVGGVLNCYRVQQQLSDTPEVVNRIVDDLYRLMLEREQQALSRSGEILDLITSSQCYSKALAQHFGDDLPDKKAECGHCSYCMTHKQVTKPNIPTVQFNQAAFDAILAKIGDRTDPRFLARVAFGISSPRITALKLKRERGSIFGSMDNHEFMTILEAFEKVCNQDGQDDKKPLLLDKTSSSKS